MMADETNYRPLEGVKVLELSTMVAAGSCGRMLADWGATVIKVEAEKAICSATSQKHSWYHVRWTRTPYLTT